MISRSPGYSFSRFCVDPSVDPSSTTMISSGLSVWANMESRQRVSVSERLNVGMIAARSGLAGSVFKDGCCSLVFLYLLLQESAQELFGSVLKVSTTFGI